MIPYFRTFQVATSYVPSTTTSSTSNNTVTAAVVDYTNGTLPAMTQLPVSLPAPTLQPHNAAITVTVDPQTTSATYTAPMGKYDTGSASAHG